MNSTQKHIDKFYAENGACCAGCDHWRWHNSVVGDCTKTPLVGTQDRVSLVGMEKEDSL